MTNITITSDAFENNGQIPKKHGYKNDNQSPQLSFSGIPSDAKSLALIMDDPDAMKPAGKVWSHWIVWNISPNTTQIKENSVPGEAIQGTTDFGTTGYGGPAPPDKEHTYIFALYALDTTLDLRATTTTKKQLEDAIKPHVLAKAQLCGRYSPD